MHVVVVFCCCCCWWWCFDFPFFQRKRKKKRTLYESHNIPIAINPNTRLNDISLENKTQLKIIQHFFNQTNGTNTFKEWKWEMEWVNTSYYELVLVFVSIPSKLVDVSACMAKNELSSLKLKHTHIQTYMKCELSKSVDVEFVSEKSRDRI